ncbi:PREDICTED: single-stranded DNA-binding protein, mitochondrial-like [Tarenaya hassleriana]|uniref:single-stranded DNA-binding protein, mitochondrial-like n=1 Tax=Tarenaya hassleriana TaxID=28532 RepID=UPI00053C1131|nr:PREDICTED: single-stranded DNA-binding protein, mitochondrial-like [Tarenaya hassleriana]
MVNSMATLSRRLYRSLLSNPRFSQVSRSFCTNTLSSNEEQDSDELAAKSDIESSPGQSASNSPSQGSGEERAFVEQTLENGLDVGVYKAILVGQVGQMPLQKKLKGGRTVTLFSVGTGGMRNNRRPLMGEEPREYANRSAVQWHRVSVYPDRLADLVLKSVQPGMVVYLEGNLETKIFSDPISGVVRRIREVAIRRNGRIVFLGKDSDMQQPSLSELRGVGYF